MDSPRTGPPTPTTTRPSPPRWRNLPGSGRANAVDRMAANGFRRGCRVPRSRRGARTTTRSTKGNDDNMVESTNPRRDRGLVAAWLAPPALAVATALALSACGSTVDAAKGTPKPNATNANGVNAVNVTLAEGRRKGRLLARHQDRASRPGHVHRVQHQRTRCHRDGAAQGPTHRRREGELGARAGSGLLHRHTRRRQVPDLLPRCGTEYLDFAVTGRPPPPQPVPCRRS